MTKGLLATNVNRGVSIIEVFLAFILITAALSASTHIILSNQKLLATAQADEAIKVTERIAYHELQKVFSGVFSRSYVDGQYLNQVTAQQKDNYTKEVLVTVNASSTLASASLSFSVFDYVSALGGETCSRELIGEWSSPVVGGSVHIGEDNEATDLVARNGMVYLSADSSQASNKDLYIVNTNEGTATVISELDTGPGISAIASASKYVYAANTSVNAQLQIIDISDRRNPYVLSQLKLPHHEASTTPGIVKSIFYYDKKVYLGTTKNTGNELHIIDVSNPVLPTYIAGVEIGTLVHSIYVRNNFAYIATPTFEQIKVLDVSVPSSVSKLSGLSLPGWQTQEGKVIYPFIDSIYLGRSVGGFNNKDNHEIVSFVSSSSVPYLSEVSSSDIASSVNGIVARPPYVFMGTGDPAKEFQVKDLSSGYSFVSSLNFPHPVSQMVCDGNVIYAALKGSDALRIMYAP